MTPTETTAVVPAAPDAGSAWVDPALERLISAAGIVLATVFAVVMALCASFLVPLRIGTVPVPLAWAVAVVGTATPVWFARYTAGTRWAAVVPAFAWFCAVLPMTARTAEGDVVVAGTWVGYGTLLVGAGTLVASLFVAVVAPTPDTIWSRRPAAGPH
ncbi:MAG TPA: hypothetical protein VGR21_02900 [Cryptosporangiaceae bacterium]|nr:hypothetical protein [Cryptosporangiaceae bacterium]